MIASIATRFVGYMRVTIIRSRAARPARRRGPLGAAASGPATSWPFYLRKTPSGSVTFVGLNQIKRDLRELAYLVGLRPQGGRRRAAMAELK